MAGLEGDYDYAFKVLVLGDSSVGKSSLIKRFHSNVFDQRLPTTIGVDFFIHDMEVAGKKVKVSCQVYRRIPVISPPDYKPTSLLIEISSRL